jgi:hypothetical protein
MANPLWGPPRIHGELLKLGIDVGQATVSKYMPSRRKPPSQTWRTFRLNHAKEIVSVDFFTVPTATFRVLFVSLVLGNERREILHFNVSDSPTAFWTGQQIVEAYPSDRVTPPTNPHSLLSPLSGARTHLGLGKDCPVSRPVEPLAVGSVSAQPTVGGLHHRYIRQAALGRQFCHDRTSDQGFVCLGLDGIALCDSVLRAFSSDFSPLRDPGHPTWPLGPRTSVRITFMEGTGLRGLRGRCWILNPAGKD